MRNFLVLGAATHVRAGLDDFGRRLVLVLLEVLHEELAELLDLLLEVGGAIPGLGGIEELVGDARAGLRDRQVESPEGELVLR